MATMTSMPKPTYAMPDLAGGRIPPPQHNSTFVHTIFPHSVQQHPYNRPLYPIYHSPETPSPPPAAAAAVAPYLSMPHNAIAAAAAAAAAANASFARTQHRPFHEVKRRRRLTPEETRRLTYVFTHHTTKPDAVMRQQLAKELGMTARAVQVWFQNRRAKVKREQDTVDKEDDIMPMSMHGLPDMLQEPVTPQGMVHEYVRRQEITQTDEHTHQQQQRLVSQEVQGMKEEELQAIESMLNLDDMMDDGQDMYTEIKEGSSECSEHDSTLDLSFAANILGQNLSCTSSPSKDQQGRNVYNLSVHTGMRDNPILSDTTLSTSLAEEDELCRNGLGIDELTSDTVSYGSDAYDEAFALYNSMASSALLQQQQQHDKSTHSSPLSNAVSTFSSSNDDPSLVSMAELMSNALSELVIPFPGSPFAPSFQDSYSASPCSLPLTPAQEMDMLDLLRLPTPMTPSLRKASMGRSIAPRCNSYNNYPFSPLVPSPMSNMPHRSGQQRQESRKSRSVANSPYHFGSPSPSKELVWMPNTTPKEIEQRNSEIPVPQDVRRIQQQSNARRYSWSVGSNSSD